jgi:hypothetical protein
LVSTMNIQKSMSVIDRAPLERYLSEILGSEVSITGIRVLGGTEDLNRPLKEYGYGTPLRIDVGVEGKCRSFVFNTVKPGGFGHERMSDRASIVLWEARAFNDLPRHVRAKGVGVLTSDGDVKGLGDCEEFFILTEMVEGVELFHDLDRIRDGGKLTQLDIERCKALAEYLVEIHALKREDPGMYQRRIRELIGHGECILGLTDSYPRNLDYISPEQLADIEKRCIDWRWKIKERSHRLSQVHGDFHPWNILFRDGTDFNVLDRSRGEWGEPADDLACMTINYLFYALQQRGRLHGSFKTLWDTFFETYLSGTRDYEVLSVIHPFFAWRALVIASPVWYPHLSLEIRSKLLNFAKNVLEIPLFTPDNIDMLLESPP